MPFHEWQYGSRKQQKSTCHSFELDGIEFHASTSGALDWICFKHVVQLLLDPKADTAPATDSSAPKQIAQKLGTSRLCHFYGRSLCGVSQRSELHL